MPLITRTFPARADSIVPIQSSRFNRRWDNEFLRLPNFHQLKPLGNHACGDFSSRMLRSKPGQSHLGNHLWEFIMLEYAKTWLELKFDRRAVTALEYGLIAGVIVATIAVGFSLLANNLSNKFSGIGTSL